MNRIVVFDIVGKNAISLQSGTKLYSKISSKVIKGEGVELDFNKVELFASPFFNASIGLLLKDVDVNTLLQRLNVENLSDVGRDLLNHVISNAINFYKNKNSFSQAIKDADVGDEYE
ncbi:STAS-like domain-containing protein [Shewanella sp. AS16]|uniref:STAS-like domain-containing protein n=1 Tax=Shewanella sp. AS16 TaxID=2907625 RepID=UPI001F42A885|nr:STAS-like domain-containing protein [Shewanella sp. AS16]MCE9686030.1 STAS-like domain-containing protein [Shewanella sp. AS16]